MQQQLFVHQRSRGPCGAGDLDVELHRAPRDDPFTGLSQCPGQIARHQQGRPQVPDRVPRFADRVLDLPPDLERALASRLWRRLHRVGQVIDLQGEARQTLEQRVVDGAAHANPLGEHHRELATNLPDVHPPRRVHEQRNRQDAERLEPLPLVEHRLDAEVPDGARVAPDPVAAVGEHAETVAARRQVGVPGLARGAGIHPIAIVIVEAIPEVNPRRIGQGEHAERDLHV